MKFTHEGYYYKLPVNAIINKDGSIELECKIERLSFLIDWISSFENMVDNIMGREPSFMLELRKLPNGDG